MFDLDRAVATWTESVFADRCVSDARVAELKDHLYCEIERLRAEGHSAEQAFQSAVATLGETTALAAEAAKDRSVLATACVALARAERRDLRRAFRAPLMAHAILWAAVMLGIALMLSKSATPDSLSFLTISLLVPCWWASEQILRRALEQGAAGHGR